MGVYMNSKRCTKCNTDKQLFEFRYRSKKGYDSECKLCRINNLRKCDCREGQLLNAYKKSDKRKGLECTISIEWIKNNITSKSCYYCGSIENLGCDRLDNSNGHTPDNVVPCCYRCNSIRNVFFTPEQMKDIAQYIKSKGY